ncbi:MAG: hypothetical protein KDA81_00320 [Planctomycetaceae bacterium]|nr:hypothetical protein [Planctomycetaceae bacterium]
MHQFYFLKVAHSSFARNWRVSEYHQFIFHGLEHYCGKEEDPQHLNPRLTNNVRDRLHLWHSGHVVPDMFSPRAWTFLVSKDVQDAFSRFDGIGFTDITIEHIVDLPMPDLGVLPNPPFDGTNPAAMFTRRAQKELMAGMADQPELHYRFRDHRQLLMAAHIDLADQLTDTERVDVNFGSFSYLETVLLSRELLQMYPIYSAGGCIYVVRDDFYAVLARFLEPDYYLTAWLDTTPQPVHPWQRPDELERRRRFIEEQQKQQKKDSTASDGGNG